MQADKCQKEMKSTNLSQKKYKKQNLPPEEESDNSNERGGGQHNLCPLVLFGQT